MRGNAHAPASLAENHSPEKPTPARAPLSNDDFKTLDQLIADLRAENRRIVRAATTRARVRARSRGVRASSDKFGVDNSREVVCAKEAGSRNEN